MILNKNEEVHIFPCLIQNFYRFSGMTKHLQNDFFSLNILRKIGENCKKVLDIFLTISDKRYLRKETCVNLQIFFPFSSTPYDVNMLFLSMVLITSAERFSSKLKRLLNNSRNGKINSFSPL